MEDPLIWSLTH
ncbi:hypothetical protein RDI58_031867 [Solanum bulbocastanum]|uniref:Uncharacterized protein n=2 Tax=Solanum TaxID=4107 RepID=A0AAN8SS21_SOLBU